jgi:hypothetical protein
MTDIAMRLPANRQHPRPTIDAEMSHTLAMLNQPFDHEGLRPTVEHVDEDDIGRLSAEAVQAQYEATAKCVEQMGEMILDNMAKVQALTKEADAALKLIAEAAKVVRDKGNLFSAQIDQASAALKAACDTCKAVMERNG